MPTVRVLVVDDNNGKIERIRELVRSVPIAEHTDVKVVGTLHDGLRELSQTCYDLVIVDLNLPMRSGEDPKQDGGVRLLENLAVSPALKKPTHIIGLTAYGELAERYSAEFKREGWCLIVFQHDSDAWAKTLARVLVHIVESKAGFDNIGFNFDLGIVTALHCPELEEVLRLDGAWEKKVVPGDDTIYHHGRFSRENVSLSVVACCADGMGMQAATALSMKLITNYRPRYLGIVGIAAGVNGNFGDVLIADQSWDYNSGKSVYKYLFGDRFPFFGRIVFEPAPDPIPSSPLLRAKLGVFEMTNVEILKSIKAKWHGDVPEWPLKTQRGPMGSGASVLENRPLINEIKRRNRKLIGVEMETFGVFTAARLSSAPKPYAFSMKSICDFGDYRKADDWQSYAAFTSAQYLYEFALAELCSVRSR
jgi:nucleoside phosphorylase